MECIKGSRLTEARARTLRNNHDTVEFLTMAVDPERMDFLPSPCAVRILPLLDVFLPSLSPPFFSPLSSLSLYSKYPFLTLFSHITMQGGLNVHCPIFRCLHH